MTSSSSTEVHRILVLFGLLHLAGCAAPVADPQESRALAANTTQVFTTDDGARLPIRSFSAGPHPKALLLALHGFNDYSRFIEDAARYFAQAGIETVAYDQRGFGGAPDRRKWVGTGLLTDDFLAILNWVRRAHPGTPLFVLGESMGGSVIAVALAQHPKIAVDGVILATPAIWSRDTMPWYQRFGIWIGAGLTPAFTLSSSEFDIVSSDNVAMRAEFAKDPLVIKETRLDTLSGLTDLMDQAILSVPKIRARTLMLYGLRDVMIPREPMIALFERWPREPAQNFRFGLYPDGYHTLLRDLQRSVVWKDVVSWMLDPDAALPSGFEQERHEVLRRLRIPEGDRIAPAAPG
jgi:alpha-beta hydrolase superfamily lysophospholipase